MNYLNEIEGILVLLKQDKGMNPKWRNKAAARLEEAQAFIRHGSIDTIHTAPDASPSDTMCTCRKNELGSVIALRRSCPVHGAEAASRLAAQNKSTNSDASKTS